MMHPLSANAPTVAELGTVVTFDSYRLARKRRAAGLDVEAAPQLRRTAGRALLVGGDESTLAELSSILNRSPLAMIRVASAASAIELAGRTHFDLCVVVTPMEIAVERFVGIFRERVPYEAQPQIVVFAPGDQVSSIARLADESLFVLSIGERPRVLARKANAVLGGCPRISERLGVKLELEVDGRKEEAEGLTENLSESGMLLRSTRGLSVGSRVGFELALDEGGLGPVRGEAEVVRRTEAEKEGVSGFGLRFISFSANGRALVRCHVEAWLAALTGVARSVATPA